MTRIVITPEDLEAVAQEIRSTAEDYVQLAREIAAIRNNLPQMAPSDTTMLAERLDSVMKKLIRLIYYFDTDIASLRWTIERIQRGDETFEVALATSLTVLNRSYALVEGVYAYAREHAMTLDEAITALKGGKGTKALVTLLSPEGSETKVALKRMGVGWIGAGLEYLDQYEASGGDWWEAAQRTLVSQGMSAGLMAGLGRLCFRFVPHPGAKLACGVIGASAGGIAGDLINEAIFGDRLTYAERQALRALESPSGLSPTEERARYQDSKDAYTEQRRLLVQDLMQDEGLSRPEAEKIAELSFPDYYFELATP